MRSGESRDSEESLAINDVEGGNDHYGAATTSTSGRGSSTVLRTIVTPGALATLGILATLVTLLSVAYVSSGSMRASPPRYTIVAACKLTKERRPLYEQALRSW